MPGHVWRRSTFGTNIVCDRCNLLPLDSDDVELECVEEESTERE